MIQYRCRLCDAVVCTIPTGFPSLANHMLEMHLQMHVNEIIAEAEEVAGGETP